MPFDRARCREIAVSTLPIMDDAFRDALRAGKRLLKEKNGSAAMIRFEKALMLSKALADRVSFSREVSS